MPEANANGKSAILIHNPALGKSCDKDEDDKDGVQRCVESSYQVHDIMFFLFTTDVVILYHLYVFLAAVASNKVIYKLRTGRHYCQGFIALLVFLIMTHSAPADIWNHPQACRHMLAGISKCASLLCKCCCKPPCPHFS
jgi:hypothetical protein